MTIKCNLSERERLELICYSIRYCQYMLAKGSPPSLCGRALREAVGRLWEDRNGGRSRAAKYRSLASVGLTWGSRKLVYEHVVPVTIIQAELLKLVDPQPEAVKEILDRMLVTCIVTDEEDKLLRGLPPRAFDANKPMARYEGKIAYEENLLHPRRDACADKPTPAAP